MNKTRPEIQRVGCSGNDLSSGVGGYVKKIVEDVDKATRRFIDKPPLRRAGPNPAPRAMPPSFAIGRA